MFLPIHALRLLDLAAQTKFECELYLGQSVVYYICISNLPMNIYSYSELGPNKFN